LKVNSIHWPSPFADHLVAKSPSAALEASLPDSCADATTEIGVSLFEDGVGGGGDAPLLNELLYNIILSIRNLIKS